MAKLIMVAASKFSIVGRNAQNKMAVKKIERCLQYLVFLDCDQLIHGAKRTGTQQATWKLYRIVSIMFMVLMNMKLAYVYVNDKKDPQLAYLYGDIYEYYGGGKMIYTFSSILACIPSILMATLTCSFVKNEANRASVQEVTAILRVLSGKAKPSLLGLKVADKLKMLTTVKLFYRIGCFFSIMVPVTFGFYPFVRRFLHDGFAQYPVNFMFFFVCWLIYCFVIISAQITLMSYFYLSCKVITLRINHLKDRIVNATRNNSQDTNVLEEHAAIMRSTKNLNNYWRHFLLSLLSSYLPLITVFLYMSLVTDNVIYIKISVYFVSVEFFVILSTICLIASEIFHQVCKNFLLQS
ncbi:hypothetical protein HDE_06648 [Halotydeus destructor]|nr:hypothetical protein HDE_06648 [Halotydeus destructor]